KSTTMSARFVVSAKLKTLAIPRYGENGTVHHLGRPLQSGRAPCKAVLYILYKVRIIVFYVVGMHRYHFFTNRYKYEYFYLCTCRYRVPIPILLRFGLHESAINLEADFILSSADYVKPMVQN